jgi:hypothetical protein
MSDWNASFIAKQWPVACGMILGLSLLVSSCAGSRAKRESDNGDRDSGADSAAEGTNQERDGSEQDADRGNGGSEENSSDPAEVRDSGDNRGRQNRDAGEGTYDADTAGNGGSGAEGGTGAGGWEGGSAAIDVPYESLQQIPNTTARVCPSSSYTDIATMLGEPCDHICSNAHCVPNSLVPVPSAVNAFSPCDQSSVCIPDSLINTMGGVQYKKCRSVGNLEGVCISECNTNTAFSVGAGFLPQDSCHESERCVPCYDPIKGGLTAFNPCGNYTPSSCNAGPTESGVVFDKCCNGNGTCIPGIEEINPEVAAVLKRDSCTGEDDLCLPALFGIQRYLPAICETQSGNEGRCLPDCIATELAEEYTQQDCAVAERCIPCSKDGVSTGACAINDDAPGRGSE